jgi:hypothetical protein
MFTENIAIYGYGVSKAWRQIMPENLMMERCTVERLMAGPG